MLVTDAGGEVCLVTTMSSSLWFCHQHDKKLSPSTRVSPTLSHQHHCSPKERIRFDIQWWPRNTGSVMKKWHKHFYVGDILYSKPGRLWPSNGWLATFLGKMFWINFKFAQFWVLWYSSNGTGSHKIMNTGTSRVIATRWTIFWLG